MDEVSNKIGNTVTFEKPSVQKLLDDCVKQLGTIEFNFQEQKRQYEADKAAVEGRIRILSQVQQITG